MESNEVNVTVNVLPIAPSVNFSLAEGSHISNQYLSLSTESEDENIIINYSVDGISFYQYDDPILLGQINSVPTYNYTVIARSEGDGYIPSDYVNKTYEIQTKLDKPNCSPAFAQYYNQTLVSCSCKTHETIQIQWNLNSVLNISQSNQNEQKFALRSYDTTTSYELTGRCNRDKYAESQLLEGEYIIKQFM